MVSFETAVKLKEAGFPQPAPKFGDVVFHRSKKTKHVVIGHEGGGVFVFRGEFDHQDRERGDSYVSAPTAADILKVAKGLYLSPIMHDDWGVFVVGSREMVGYHHENPAEACAEAWLKINKK